MNIGNEGFGYGQYGKRYSLEQAEREAKIGRYDKKEFRRGYWFGRIHYEIDWNVKSCLKYMSQKQLRKLQERLHDIYVDTLEDMYGKDEATKFLKKFDK